MQFKINNHKKIITGSIGTQDVNYKFSVYLFKKKMFCKRKQQYKFFSSDLVSLFSSLTGYSVVKHEVLTTGNFDISYRL